MQVTELSADQIVMVLVAVVAPLVVGLVTKASWGAHVKAIILAFVSAAIGVAQGFLAAPSGTTWSWSVAVVNGVLAWIIAVATHFGLWKPTGITELAQKSHVDPTPCLIVCSDLNKQHG